MQDYKLYKKQLIQLEQQLAGAHHRQLVLVTGNDNWCYELTNSLVQNTNTLTLSKHCALKNAQWPAHIHQILGQEFTHAIYDGFSGLYPDKLAAIAGTVRAGGVLFVLLPELGNLNNWQDPALKSVQSHGHSNQYSLFNQRFSSIIKSLPALHYSEEFGCINNNYNYVLHSNIDFEPQKNCVAQIVKVAHGRANRPLLLNADRGRGKSAALGLAAAKLADKNVIICATQFRATHSSFKHLAAQLNVNYDPLQKQLANMQYIAPDALLNELPECDILLVDEAAAIPVPMLLSMLAHYPRIVFASTLVGYEGNGRGYTIRFSQYIKNHYKASKVITLDEPLRFAKHDPLEQHIRSLLALDAQYQETNSNKSQIPKHSEVTQQQLVTDEALLCQVVALLALAHYQSSVNDLRQLLDAPSQRIFISKIDKQLVGVCLIAIEGGLSEELTEQVISGERRPQGHLMAQTLAQLSFNSDFLTHLSARVVRIAIDPSSHYCGLGKALLSYSESQVKEQCTWFGASFGATAQLLKFWQSLGFNAVKLGYQRDKSTAEHATLVVKSLNAPQQSLQSLIKQFQYELFYGLLSHFKSLEWQLVSTLLRSFNDEVIASDTLRLFTQQLSSNRFTISPTLWRLISQNPVIITRIAANQQQLLIQTVLQHHTDEQLIKNLNLSGKKQLEQLFRNTTNILAKQLSS